MKNNSDINSSVNSNDNSNDNNGINNVNGNINNSNNGTLSSGSGKNSKYPKISQKQLASWTVDDVKG